MQKIIADDFGLCPLHDAAILHLIKNNAIHGTSVLVHPMIDTDTLKELTHLHQSGKCKVGLHLNFTYNLETEKSSNSVMVLLIKAFLGTISKSYVKTKIQQQLDLFKKQFGFFPDFLDGHQHCHVFPRIAAEVGNVFVFVDGRPKDFWIRIPDEVRSIGLLQSYRQGGFKAILVSSLARSARKQFERQNLNSNAAFTGFLDLQQNSKSFILLFKSMLKIAPENAVIMVHPGSVLSAKHLKGHKNELRHIETTLLLERLHGSPVIPPQI